MNYKFIPIFVHNVPVSKSVYVFTCMCLCETGCVWVCQLWCVNASVCSCVFLCVVLCMFVCLCVYVYIYIYTYIWLAQGLRGFAAWRAFGVWGAPNGAPACVFFLATAFFFVFVFFMQCGFAAKRALLRTWVFLYSVILTEYVAMELRVCVYMYVCMCSAPQYAQLCLIYAQKIGNDI